MVNAERSVLFDLSRPKREGDRINYQKSSMLNTLYAASNVRNNDSATY